MTTQTILDQLTQSLKTRRPLPTQPPVGIIIPTILAKILTWQKF